MRSSFAHILPKEIGWRKDKIGYEPPQKNWMDNAELKNMIKEQRRILVAKNILSPKILNADVMSEDATSSIDKSWIHWMSSFTVT
jgi:asparagine synthase (glutamine-hydrolysing)